HFIEKDTNQPARVFSSVGFPGHPFEEYLSHSTRQKHAKESQVVAGLRANQGFGIELVNSPHDAGDFKQPAPDISMLSNPNNLHACSCQWRVLGRMDVSCSQL